MLKQNFYRIEILFISFEKILKTKKICYYYYLFKSIFRFQLLQLINNVDF